MSPINLKIGRHIIGYNDNGKPVYSNENTTDPPIGEILLRKDPFDSICNICLNTKILTVDHVPPKCTGNRGRFRYISFMNYMANPSASPLGLSQNGIKYQTICEECNTKRLKECDDELALLFRPFVENDSQPIVLGKPTQLRANLAIRGILGHFVAAKTSHLRSSLEELFAQSLLDQDKPIPSELGFYVLPYISSQIRILRDVLLFINEKQVVFNIVKVYPFAFIITSDRVFPNLPNWHQYFDVQKSEVVTITPFQTQPVNYDWPENVRPIMFGKSGSESVIAFPE